MILILLRHGKAQPDAPRGDHARTLVPEAGPAVRGIGEALAAHDFVPAHVLVSTAARTLETLGALPRSLVRDATVVSSAAIYNAAAEELVAEVRSVRSGGGATTIMVIGHNPALSQVAHWLAPEGATVLKPGDADVLELQVDAELAPGAASRLATFQAERG